MASVFYYLYQTAGYIHLVVKQIPPDLTLFLLLHGHIPIQVFFSPGENAIHILELNTRLGLSSYQVST